MSGSACSRACGYCGRCTSNWEAPRLMWVLCADCGEYTQVESDDEPPHRCEVCQRRRAIRAQKGAA